MFAVQRSFADLGRPLLDTTFVVVDLETTGGDRGADRITEIGAVRVRAGEVEGEFHTLVHPGCAIPPTITVLTGITESMVRSAPRIEQVLPSFLEFLGEGVVAGHNVRFDVGFLDAALERTGRDPLTGPHVDTLPLARRLVRDEVPNCKLGTLAEHLRLRHRPSHRALDDARATVDLLHLLLERAGSLGVTGLDDLVGLPAAAAHPQARKLSLTDRLPRAGGVYLFRDGAGRVLYVGKAANLRSRVRSYFSTDDRRKVSRLLGLTQRIDHKRTDTPLESAVLELRLIRLLDPPFNSQGTRWQSNRWLRPTVRGGGLRVCQAHEATPDAFGPLPSARAATAVVDAVRSAVLGSHRTPADLLAVARDDPDAVAAPLRDRMMRAAAAERFEDAASLRDRLTSWQEAWIRVRRLDSWRNCGRLVVADGAGHRYELVGGVLRRVRGPRGVDGLPPWREVQAPPTVAAPTEDAAVDPALVDELLATARWLESEAAGLRLLHGEGWRWPVARVEPVRPGSAGGDSPPPLRRDPR